MSLVKLSPGYSHGRYYGMGEELGSFGYSVRKAEKKKILIGKTAGKQAGGKAPETGKKTSSGKKNTGNPGGKAGSGAGKPRRQ